MSATPSPEEARGRARRAPSPDSAVDEALPRTFSEDVTPANESRTASAAEAQPRDRNSRRGGRGHERREPERAEEPAELAVERPRRDHPRFAVALDADRIDPDVQKVVRRLVRGGYEAYLVGGCVRDLLLGGKPKDFDVATSARPEQVRELFRNSRVIGRRFRLVHVLFHGGKVIEVATFRRKPNEEIEAAGSIGGGDELVVEPDAFAAGPSIAGLLDDDAAVILPGSGDRRGRRTSAGAPPARQLPPGSDTAQLLIRSDNVFGEAHEDASRRDFTINALFYDVEASQTLDWVGGLADIGKRVVNTIGEPHLRFREDPVRILRALKFAGRLDLGITPEVYDAIVECRSALELAARPRVAEEVLKLLRGGGARRTIYLAWETGVLEVLLPELAALLYDSFNTESTDAAGHRVFRLLEFIDNRTMECGSRDDTVLWTLLLLEPLKEATEGARDRSAAAIEFLDPLLERLAIPRRFSDGMRRILAVLPRILSGKAGRFARTELFDLALEVAEADLYARGQSVEPVRALRSNANASEPARNAAPAGRSPHRGPARRESSSSHGRPRPTPRH